MILPAALCCIGLKSLAADLQLVSTRDDSVATSASAAGDSYMPEMSPDGRYVLFSSAANNLVLTNSRGLVPGNTLHALNVYLRDRLNGTTIMVSVNAQGDGGNGDSFPAGISTNGQYALFESLASDLVPGDSNNGNDIFIRDLVNGTTRLISVATNGASGNGNSRSAVMTPDGRFVAFASDARNLVPGDTNNLSDIFYRDVQAGTTTWVSAGSRPNSITLPTFPSRSESPVISSDGRFVAFYSSASNVMSSVPYAGEVYVRDMVGGTTIWASTNGRSLSPDAISCCPVISADGQFVAFETCTNSRTRPGRGFILRYNLQTQVTDLIYTNAIVPYTVFHEIHIIDMTPDGQSIAFVASNAVTGNTTVCRWDAQTASNAVISLDQTTGLPANGASDNPVIDPAGQYVAFTSNGSNLTTNTGSASAYHLYVCDTHAGNIRMIDVDTNGVGLGVTSDPSAITLALSGEGHLAFDSSTANLVADDWNGDSDVFLCDLTTNTVELVSAHHPAVPSVTLNRFSEIYPGSISTNGRYVAFVSFADNAWVNDTNRFQDVFVRDLVAGTNVSVSTSGGSTNHPSTDMTLTPVISGNGRYVAFTSLRAYIDGDKNNNLDVYVRDLQTGAISLISSNFLGGPSVTPNNASWRPVINNDGRFVLFDSFANNVAVGLGSPITPTENLILRDRLLATNYALTTGTAGLGVVSAAMTPDGRYIVYSGDMNGGGGNKLFLWDTQAGKIVYTNSTFGITNAVISPAGRWTVYTFATTSLRILDLINKTNGQVGPWVGPFRGKFQFSSDDRFLLFDTKETVVAGDLNGTYDVYLHDFLSGTNILVSRSFGSSHAANALSDQAALSPDGRFVAYRSRASDIVPGDTNSLADIFLYDRINNATLLVSAAQNNTTSANGPSMMPMFSGDSRKLIFESYAADLSAPGINESCSIYALNLATTPVTDTDGDGMDDQWEQDHFGTLAYDGTGDFDGDGASNLFEFLTGTDSTDPRSIFRATISGVLAPGQKPVIDWPLAPGRGYRVQYKDDLTDPNWRDVSGSMVLIGSHGRITDLTPSAGQRFYRIVLNN